MRTLMKRELIIAAATDASLSTVQRCIFIDAMLGKGDASGEKLMKNEAHELREKMLTHFAHINNTKLFVGVLTTSNERWDLRHLIASLPTYTDEEYAQKVAAAEQIDRVLAKLRAPKTEAR